MPVIAKIAEKMIARSKGNLHDINHFMKVWAYAKTIGELEGLDEKTQRILEAAALVHDIGFPFCRETYGDTSGPLQEREGAILAAEFLKDSGLAEDEIERIVYLVAHHHTYSMVDGADYQILLEADYFVNADEKNQPKENVRNFCAKVFKTEAGTALFKAMYQL